VLLMIIGKYCSTSYIRITGMCVCRSQVYERDRDLYGSVMLI
jgi:hypothetical protein